MSPFDLLAEERIREAQARGEFDDLPGSGRPLDLEDDPLVPEELRVAYRLLRNAGFVPPELEARAEIRALEDLLEGVYDGARHVRVAARIRFLLSRCRVGRDLRLEQDYFDKINERFAVRRVNT